MGRAAGQSDSFVAVRRPIRRRGSRTPYRWTDEALEAELRVFTHDLTEFPTLLDFDVAARSDLRCAVVDFGGPLYWSKRISLPMPPSRERRTALGRAARADDRQL